MLNTRQTAIDKQIEQCVLIGPLLMLGALIVLYLTPIRPILLTSVALIGLPLCWKWRLPAAIAATVITITILIYQFAFTGASLPLWHIGFATTVSLTLWITAFCSQEVEHLFAAIQEGTSPATSKTQIIKNELAQLAKKKGDEQRAAEAKIENLELLLSNHEKQLLEQSQSVLSYKKQFDELQAQNSGLQQKLSASISETTTLKQSCDELIEKSRIEQLKSNELHEKCAELAGLTAKITALEQLRFEENEIWESSNSALLHKLAESEELLRSKEHEWQDNARNLTRLEEQNAGLLQEVFQRRHECTRLKQYSEELNESLQSKITEAVLVSDQSTVKLNAEIEEKQSLLLEQQELIAKLQDELNLNQLELTECRQKADELVNICAQKESLLVEQIEKVQNATPDREMRKLEGLYKQLKEQFSEKSSLLDSTRQELFTSSEELAKLKREHFEKEFDAKQAEYLKSIENQLQTTTDELIAAEKRHVEEIDALQLLIKNLTAVDATEAVETEETVQKPKSAAKGRTPKQTKTTNWANAILSRCAEPPNQKPGKK